jgi:hypothetical protein
VKEEVYTSQEVLYVAATDAIGAQMGWVAGDTHETTGEAWNSLSYWDSRRGQTSSMFMKSSPR